MFRYVRWYLLTAVTLSLSLLAFGCGQEDGGISTIGDSGGTDSSIPPEVQEAMRAGLDEVEVPVIEEREGLAKPTELSTIFHIDYVSPVQETHVGSTDTTCGSAANFKKLRYKWTAFPVTYSIDTTNVTAGTDTGAAKKAVVNAFNTWDTEEHPATQFFAEDTSNPKVTVSWQPIDGAGGVLAYASTTYYVTTKAAVQSRVVYDSGDTWRVFGALSCSSQGTEFAFDIEDVGAHEIGHVVGLGHTPKDFRDTPLTMYPYILHVGETLKRTLGTGDRLGIAQIYP